VNCAATYAFSLYGLGRTAAGLEIIRKLPVEEIHDPHAAVFVAVLLIDENQFDAAKEYIETARHGSIFLEEKKLLDEAVAKMTPPSSTAAPTVPIRVPDFPIPNVSSSPKPPATAPPRRELQLPTPNNP
jgi:hypothetical protein